MEMHWDSLYSMDFMTIDTLFGRRFYLLLILELKTRKIIRFDMTENPCREFVKQRIEMFSEEYEGQKKTLIFDNAVGLTSRESKSVLQLPRLVEASFLLDHATLYK